MGFAWAASSLHAQEPKRAAGSVQISFLPPPLERATYSVGIFEAKTGKLVRQVQTAAAEKDFTVGLNGLITSWDGKDDSGKPVSPGHYAARGYAVGPLKIQGESIAGNDWTSDDENFRPKRIAAIQLLPGNAGLAALAVLADDTFALVRYSAEDKLRWREPVHGLPADARPFIAVSGANVAVIPNPPVHDEESVTGVGTYRIEDGERLPLRVAVGYSANLARLAAEPHEPRPIQDSAPTSDPGFSVRPGANPSPTPERAALPATVTNSFVQRSPGKGQTEWTAGGTAGLIQTAADGTTLRKLEVAPGDPVPLAVTASTDADRLYLLEEKPGWQRVRGLSWVETKEENGHPVSTWQTFFERDIRQPDPASTGAGSGPLEVALDDNPLSPSKPQKIRLVATFDGKGSYLATESGLRLRRVSERSSLENAHLVQGKPSNRIEFFQRDGAATDEFSITGVRHMMEFDAGEFELTANGEKPVETKPAEPPEL